MMNDITSIRSLPFFIYNNEKKYNITLALKYLIEKSKRADARPCNFQGHEDKLEYGGHIYGSLRWLLNITLSTRCDASRSKELLAVLDSGGIISNEISVNTYDLIINGTRNQSSAQSQIPHSHNDSQSSSQSTTQQPRLLPGNSFTCNRIDEMESRARSYIQRREFDSDIFRSKCAKCGHTTLITPPSREKNILQIGAKDHYYRNSKVRQWVLGFKWQLYLMNQLFVNVMLVYFLLYPQEFLTIAKSWISVAVNRDAMRKLVMDHAAALTVPMIVYVKDRTFLSDQAYFYFYHSLYLNWLFPKKCDVALYRRRINAFIIQQWGIVEAYVGQIKIGWKCTNIGAILQSMLAIEMKAVGRIPERLILKISGDGRKHNGGQNIFTLNPLNLSQFSTQSRDSIIPMLFWKGDEKAIRELAESLMPIVYRYDQNGIYFTDQKNRRRYVLVDLRIVWSSDLAFLDAVCDGTLYSKSDMCCPYCCAHKWQINDFSTRYPERTITIYGREIPIAICTLHCKQAITRRLLKNIGIIYSSDPATLHSIQSTISAFPGLRSFKFKVDATPANPFDEYDNDDDMPELDSGKLRIPKLTGYQCDVIIQRLARSFECIDPHDQMQADIWKLWAFICFGYIEATSDQLQNRDMQLLKQMLVKLEELSRIRFSSDRMGYYWHIILAHLEELLAKFGSLQPYSNQGLEAHHQLAESVEKHATSRGGKVSKKRVPTDLLLQIFLYPLRLLILAASYPDINWNLRRERAPRSDKRLINQQQHNLNYIFSDAPDDHPEQQTDTDNDHDDIIDLHGATGSETRSGQDADDDDEDDQTQNPPQPPSQHPDDIIRYNMERIARDIVNKPLTSYRYVSERMQRAPPSVQTANDVPYHVPNYDTTEQFESSLFDDPMELLEHDEYVARTGDDSDEIINLESNTDVDEAAASLLYDHPTDSTRFNSYQQQFTAALFNAYPAGTSDDLVADVNSEANDWYF